MCGGWSMWLFDEVRYVNIIIHIATAADQQRAEAYTRRLLLMRI